MIIFSKPINRILVTGGSGFIGGTLIRRLLKETSHKVFNLDKLGYAWAKNCYHLSYGMVDLPTGRMKSREGTVVDADNFVDEMVDTAKNIANQLISRMLKTWY